jgi:hypothetical protein
VPAAVDATRASAAAAGIAGAIEISGLVRQLLSFLRIGSPGPGHVYLGGLIVLLVGACFSFVRMIWVSTRKAE